MDGWTKGAGENKPRRIDVIESGFTTIIEIIVVLVVVYSLFDNFYTFVYLIFFIMFDIITSICCYFKNAKTKKIEFLPTNCFLLL